MTPQINPAALRPGMILHSRSTSVFGRYIRRVLTRWVRRELPDAVPVWGNHDALVVDLHGKVYIGDAVSPFCRLTPVETWNGWLATGEQAVRFFWPAGATAEDGAKASSYWLQYVNGRPYDWMSFPRLFLKSLFGDIVTRLHGWEWAWFCTEGVGRAWFSVYGDTRVFGKYQPTPLTVEKRAGWYGGEVTLLEVTGDVVADGAAEAPQLPPQGEDLAPMGVG